METKKNKPTNKLRTKQFALIKSKPKLNRNIKSIQDVEKANIKTEELKIFNSDSIVSQKSVKTLNSKAKTLSKSKTKAKAQHAKKEETVKSDVKFLILIASFILLMHT